MRTLRHKSKLNWVVEVGGRGASMLQREVKSSRVVEVDVAIR
jgi:hypothetical protein